MAAENIKATEEMNKKNDKAMTEKAGLERKLNSFCWVDEKSLNKLVNSSVQVSYFHIKLKSLNNANHHMQQENAHMMERFGQFEIFEENLRNKVMTTHL